MKVILTQNVKGVVVAGEAVDVSDGYARNYLLPHGFAQIATDGLLRQTIVRQAEAERKKARDEAAVRDALERLGKVNIEIRALADEKGHLYAALKEKEILATIQEKVGTLPPGFKLIDFRPIKTAGNNEVLVGDGNARKKIVLKVSRQS